MGKFLLVEIRNTNFGPVKNGDFFATQVEGTQQFGIGDGLFIPPRGIDAKNQYGYEELVQPIFTIAYKDKTISEVKGDPKQFPPVGTTFVFPIPLLEDKNCNDIECIKLHVEAPLFGHSGSGGCGMSYIGKYKIGSAIFDGNNISSDDKIITSISLSDRWDLSLAPEELPNDRNKLIEINFLSRSKAKDDAWKKIELVEDWRSALAPSWNKSTKYKEEQNLHGYSRWTIPIKAFDSEKEGWVIGINNGSRLTDGMEKHAQDFRKYQESAPYQKEEREYLNYFYTDNRFLLFNKVDSLDNGSPQVSTELKIN